jgi:hypothetical protein
MVASCYHTRTVALDESHHQSSTSIVIHGGPCNLDGERTHSLEQTLNFAADHSIDPQSSPSSSVTTAHKRASQMMDEVFQHAVLSRVFRHVVFLREPKPEPDGFHDAQDPAWHYFQSVQNTCSSGDAGPLAMHPPDQNQSEISSGLHAPFYLIILSVFVLKITDHGNVQISYIDHGPLVFVPLSSVCIRGD